MDPEPSDGAVAEQLDQEIADMQQHIASLKKQLNVQTTNLLTAESTRHLLQATSGLVEPNPVIGGDEKLLARRNAQEAHDQLNLYRTVAGITSFKVRDPDPNAVDGGKVLGLRIEVMTKSRFLRPYYVMLNRPYPNSRRLRVHRHTVPPCIPLSGLAFRHLPPPPKDDTDPDAAEQDLARFARELRREIVRYHNRAGAIGAISQAATAGAVSDVEDDDDMIDVRAADPQAKQIELGWADGRTGRIILDDDGKIEKMVVYRFDVRDHETKKQVLGESLHIDDVVKLMSVRTQESTPQG
ncbi:Cenp-O kinetochore centromere component-domain-containing protein [Plectosphaerella plurivora]|uniref:Cenp-O kinetochore centromere component-domain-containing protein n=1 Tax=Plectosphaerella plurivora TaxID=936078 RepID=A0A9P8V188_9PEZI|nr:Cenp-O kinetochore centromere component-domain-containing protein [Plectosphaerella plurivora]